MLAITILLATLLGGINILNVYTVSNNNEKLLYRLAQIEQEASLQIYPKEFPDNKLLQRNDLGISQNDQLSALYFIVRVSDYGIVEQIELERIASVSPETALELYQTVKDSGNVVGKIGQYQYRVVETFTGTSYVFLDLERPFNEMIRIALLSILGGGIAWIVMFFITLFISKKAIAPIVENMEKQKQFITNAGHELKTPLAIIQTNTEALELHTGETKWSKNIRTQVERLSSLTQNLLTLAKLDEQASLSMVDINLSEKIENLQYEYIESANARKIKMNLDIDENVHINGNEVYIQNLLSIFFDNAMKYTNEEGIFNVICKKDKTLIFENTCDDLEEIQVESLTDRFYQNDTSHASKGFGIGLSAAKSIIEAHSGKLSINKVKDKIQFKIEFIK